MNTSLASVNVPASRMPLAVSTFLTYAMLLSMPMVDVFAPSVWLIPPMTIGLALTAWLIRCNELHIDRLYVVLLLLIAVCFVPWLATAEYISFKTAFHAGAIIASATVYYLGMRTALTKLIREGAAFAILRAVYFALLFCSLYILVEFAASNLAGYDIAQFVPHITVPDLEAQVFGLLLRARGFAAEPGVMALYYDFALFFVLPILRLGWRYRIGYACIIVPSYLTLFSTASLVGVVTAAVVLLVWRFGSRFIGSTFRVAAVAGIAMAVLFTWRDEVIEFTDLLIVSRVSALVTGSGEDSSSSVRRSHLDQVAQVVGDYPAGIGFGVAPGLADAGVNFRGMAVDEGQISLFAMILLSGGVVALLLLTGVVGFSIFQSLKIPHFGPYIAAGGLAISLHQLSITEFWLPFFWFFLACASAFRYYRPSGPGAAS